MNMREDASNVRGSDRDPLRAAGKDLALAVRAGQGYYGTCAPEGIRTPNLLIRSQMLYPLSYGRSIFSCARLSLSRPGRSGGSGI